MVLPGPSQACDRKAPASSLVPTPFESKRLIRVLDTGTFSASGHAQRGVPTDCHEVSTWRSAFRLLLGLAALRQLISPAFPEVHDSLTYSGAK